MANELKSESDLEAELLRWQARAEALERENLQLRQAQGMLKQRMDMEMILSTISKTFANLADSEVDSAIEESLKRIANYAGSDRAAVFWFSPDGAAINLTHEWASRKEWRVKGRQEPIASRDVPWFMETINKLRNVAINRLSDLPAEAQKVRELLRSKGVKSWLASPMIHGGWPIGFVTLSAMGDEVAWQEPAITILEIASDMFAKELTERQSRQALLKAGSYSRRLIEASTDPLITVDQSGRIVDVNAAAETITELPRQKLIGTELAEYFTDPQKVREVHRLAFEAGRSAPCELEIRGQKGRSTPILYSVSAYKDEAGNTSGLFACAHDMSYNKQTEKEIQHLASFPQLTPNPILEVNARGEVIFSNNATRHVLRSMDVSQDSSLFLPKNMPGILQNLPTARPRHFRAEAEIEGRVFGEDIYLIPHLNVARIYATDITDQKNSDEELKASLQMVRTVMDGVVHALSAAAELRDPYTAGHQKRVSELACAIARKMDLDDEDYEAVRVAGLLHDIGKIYVPAELLVKPGKLTPVEFGIIKVHPEAGHGILKTIDFPWPVAQIVQQHHERIDGTGYPGGLMGSDIILGARIIAVADVVEAMASHRPYRPALGIKVALKEIAEGHPAAYDSLAVRACTEMFNTNSFEFH
ncbi:MAG: HD domain-containing protein [Planctomycetes bacterium]|nr:HD domain-containing protein [Planctomycetota bacterium]